VGDDFAVDVSLSNPSGYQSGVLRSEIQHEHRLLVCLDRFALTQSLAAQFLGDFQIGGDLKVITGGDSSIVG